MTYKQQTSTDSATDITENNQTKKRFIKREGTTGGKLPWLSWKNGRTMRHISQSIFLLINAYIGITFYLWVKYYETGGASLYVDRPAGIEGWLPIAGLMNLKFFLATHQLPPIYTGAMLLLIAFVVISLILKKSFCSWLCPVGTLSEILWRLGNRIFKRQFILPKWLDIPLRTIKYLILAVVFYFLIPMSAQEIVYFLTSPYGIIIDVKMLDFFRHIGQTTLIVVTILTISSLFIPNVWCRYLCPYGALIGIASLFSPFKIRRDANACIDCNRCAKACPARLSVDKVIQIRSIECNTCLSCVEVCPVQDALQLSLKPARKTAGNVVDNDAINNSNDASTIKMRWKGRKLSGIAVIITIYLILIGVIGYAKYIDRWDSPVPQQYYQMFIPKAGKLGHP